MPTQLALGERFKVSWGRVYQRLSTIELSEKIPPTSHRAPMPGLPHSLHRFNQPQVNAAHKYENSLWPLFWLQYPINKDLPKEWVDN